MNVMVQASRRRYLKAMLLSSLGFWGNKSIAQSQSLGLLCAESDITEESLVQFYDESGISIVRDYYYSTADFIASFLSRSPRYDVIIAPSYLISRLYQSKLLSSLDYQSIPNVKHLNSKFMHSDFDPDRRFSLPYMLMIQGIVYNKKIKKKSINSWKWLFDSEDYSGRVAIPEHSTLLLKCALKYLGYQGATNYRALRHAEELLIKQKKHLSFFNHARLPQAWMEKQYVLSMGWSADILQAMKKNKALAYANPKEGSVIVESCVCIPRYAPNRGKAYKFLDFLLRAEVAAEIAEAKQILTPNRAALALLPKRYKDNPAIFPRPDVLSQSEILADEGHYLQELYMRSWRRIMEA